MTRSGAGETVALPGEFADEEYSTPEGFEGRSFSTYDARRGVWHRTWVYSANQLLVFEGARRDSAMVLESTSIRRNGWPARHRISWTTDEAGDVRQLRETSRDDVRTVEVFFDGRYQRVP